MVKSRSLCRDRSGYTKTNGIEAKSGRAVLTLFFTFGFMLTVPMISSPVFTVR